ncbi:nuclear localization sequence binding protein [Cystobasidium minutum MCA 4210]|uniref:nuclear localization sequence binding protein n=1 Tax=Cystobasidium minutum MCA 4210 TaxID=1397322 RepID=UPI0034CD17E5|eukprot:jgi/Rhomi1/169943/fgenesh1_kg.3_\
MTAIPLSLAPTSTVLLGGEVHTTMSAMETVLAALQTLYTDPKPEAKQQANEWLQNFQKEPEAWETANVILSSADAPDEPKLFAAQTFRAKIIYDLDQLPADHRIPLRDTIVAALKNASASGSKVIITQLALALADLLLQLPEWRNGLQDMIDQFGKDPQTVPALLDFLKVLPQENMSNVRVRITNPDWRTDATGTEVLNLIGMYFQAPGVTSSVRAATLKVLASWLRAGEMIPSAIQQSPFFNYIFESLASEALFDDSVDLLVDLIHETQEIADNMEPIQAIVPRLPPLRQPLAQAIEGEDSEAVRGYCRIFVEAGECYAQLMLQHPSEFMPIVEAIADCSAYSDLEVVTITLNFWWKLAVGLRKGGFVKDPACQPFLEVIARLVDTVIQHLRYPDDVDSLTGQDRDDFRDFRHDIGNTLKDCCSVLGSTACLARSFAALEAEVAKGPAGQWQIIEAALFSIRTMGAKVDLQENVVMPKLFEAIPQLPQTNAKVRYSATLVVGRYTEWLSEHAEYLPKMMEYVFSGFNVGDADVTTASASALKYLCKDCSSHLFGYLPALFDFVQQHASALHREDLIDIYSGYADIIAKMPPNDAINALQTFCAPLLGRLQELATASTTGAKGDVPAATHALEHINILLEANSHLADDLPPTCANTANEIWQILSHILHSHSEVSSLETICSTLRRGLPLFGKLALPLVPSLLDTMTSAFERTGVSGFIWITGKAADLTRLPEAQEHAESLEEHLKQAFERITKKIVELLNKSSLDDIQDCIEDYAHLIKNLADQSPSILFLSPAFPSAIQIAISSVNLLNPNVSHDALDAVRVIVGHDALNTQNTQGYGAPSHLSPRDQANMPAFAAAIKQVLSGENAGQRLVQILLTRLVTDFHEDIAPMSITIARLLTQSFPQEMAQWIPAAVQSLPAKAVKDAERDKFLAGCSKALQEGNPNAMRSAWVQLDRASRKERERKSLADARV